MLSVLNIESDYLRWSNAWSLKSFRFQFIAACLGMVLLTIVAPHFLFFAEHRTGVPLNDPILSNISPVDVSWSIFALIYVSLLVTVLYITKNPVLLLNAMLAYYLLTFLRFSCIFLFPLEPSPQIIPLSDPFADIFIYNHQIITKDLFFSGHASTLFLAAFIIQNKWLKFILILSAIAVGILLIIQHVHYTIDVLASPFFAWLSFFAIKQLKKNKF